jgi:peptide methionine sulfoxide reductase msrA/msrB
MKDIYLAGGCFWGLEKYFSLVSGVVETESGYANGSTENPTYEDLCYRNTGHAETVRIRYDPARIGLEEILSLYYAVIDPVSVNRQGADRGTQYRTGIYFTDESDEPLVRASAAELQKRHQKPLAIEIQRLENYYPAEEYHQKYLDKNPGGYCHIGKEAFEKVSQRQSVM